MPIVELEDGTELDIPDDTPMDAIKRYVEQVRMQRAPAKPEVTMPPVGDYGVDPKVFADESLKQWRRAGNAGVAAGATAIGGGGPIMAAISGYLGRDLDPTTGYGIASTALNAGGGKLFDIGKQIGPKLGPFLTGAKDAALGAGEVGGAQALGSVLSGAMGEQTRDLDPMEAILGGAGAAMMPPLMGKFLSAYQQAPPQVRAKMLPLIEALRQKVGQSGGTQAPVPVNLNPMSVEEIVQQAPQLPHTMRTPVGDGGLSRTYDKLTAANEMEMRQRLAKWIEMNSIDPQTGISRDMVQKATNLYGTDADALIDRMRGKGPQLAPNASLEETLAASLAARGIKPPPVPAAPSTDDLAAQLEASLKARGVQPPAPVLPTPTPTPKPAVSPTPEPAIVSPAAAPEARGIYGDIDDRLNDLMTRSSPLRANSDVMATVKAMKEKGAQTFIDEALSDANLQNLPRTLSHLNEAFPEGQVRDAVREKIVQKILDGVGDPNAAAFGDLSLIQKLKNFGNQKFDGKSGTQVINDIFGSDGMHHLNNLYDVAEKSIEKQLHSGKDWAEKIKFFVNTHNVVAGLGNVAGLGTLYIASPAAAGAGLGVKAISIGADQFGKLAGRSRSKWSDVLKDLVEGTQRYTPAQVNAVLSELRRVGVNERDLTQDEANREIDARFMAQ